MHSFTPAIPSPISQAEACQFRLNDPADAQWMRSEGEIVRRVLEELRSPGEVVFDVGARFGFLSVHAAKKGARVVAFEPDPRLRARLRENLRLNDVPADVVAWAAADKKGASSLPGVAFAAELPVHIPIVLDTIDNGLARRELPPPTLIKLDADGGEAQALKGMSSLLASEHRPRVIFLRLRQGDANAEQAVAALRAAGYTCNWEQALNEQVHQAYRRAA